MTMRPEPKAPISLPFLKCDHGVDLREPCSACRWREWWPLVVLAIMFAVGVTMLATRLAGAKD